MTRPRWLVFGVGNPSRGDDALGPLFIERLEAWSATAGDLPVALATLTDFQWQIEHALDLVDIDVVIFVDASVSASPPFELAPLAAKFDASHSTHALSPAFWPSPKDWARPSRRRGCWRFRAAPSSLAPSRARTA